MSILSDVRAGLRSRLSSIVGLNVYEYPPDGALEYPAAVIEPVGDIDYDLAVGGNSFQHTITVTVYLRAARSDEGWMELDAYRSPVGAKSIKAAVAGDRTWGGTVDDSRVVRSLEVRRGRDEAGKFWEYSCQFEIQFVKTVA